MHSFITYSRMEESLVNVYREIGISTKYKNISKPTWSPCGKFIAAFNFGNRSEPPNVMLWQATTGILSEWAITTAFNPIKSSSDNHKYCEYRVRLVLSSTRLLVLDSTNDTFAMWSVPDGRLLAVRKENHTDNRCFHRSIALGVPDTVSKDIVLFGGVHSAGAVICVWDVSTSPPKKLHHLTLSLLLNELIETQPSSLSFSPDGSKFVTEYSGDIFVIDVVTLSTIGMYRTPSFVAKAVWMPSDQNKLMVSWGNNSTMELLLKTCNEPTRCIWDWRGLEAPPIITVNPGGAFFHTWSPNGTTYYVIRGVVHTLADMTSCLFDTLQPVVLEERRVTDDSLVRVVNLEANIHLRRLDFKLSISPDMHALIWSVYTLNPSVRVLVME